MRLRYKLFRCKSKIMIWWRKKLATLSPLSQSGESPNLPHPKLQAGIRQFLQCLGEGDRRGRLGAKIGQTCLVRSYKREKFWARTLYFLDKWDVFQQFLSSLLSRSSALWNLRLVYIETMILNTQMPPEYCHLSDFALVQSSSPRY